MCAFERSEKGMEFNMKIKDCMCENVKWVTPETNVWNCAKVMQDNKIGCVPVCNKENEVVGIVTDRDVILRVIACDKDYKNTPVSDIMTTNVCVCEANSEIEEAENLMSKNSGGIDYNKEEKLISDLSETKHQNTENAVDLKIINLNGDKESKYIVEAQTIANIIDEMIANAWFTVREYHIHLSGMLKGEFRDALEFAIVQLAAKSELPSNASKVEIKNAIKQYNTNIKKRKYNFLNLLIY